MRKTNPRRGNWVTHFIQQLCSDTISIRVSAGTALSKNKIWWAKSDFYHTPSFHDYSHSKLTHNFGVIASQALQTFIQPWPWRVGPTYCLFTFQNPRGTNKVHTLGRREAKKRIRFLWERLVYHPALGYWWVLSWLSADILRMAASLSPLTETNYSVLLPGPRLCPQGGLPLSPSPQ